MAQIFEITHEVGDLSEWDTDASGGDITNTTGAALAGSTRGLNVAIGANTEERVEKGVTISTNNYRFRFYIDINGITSSSADSWSCAGLSHASGATRNVRVDVTTGADPDAQTMRLVVYEDGSSTAGTPFALSNEPHYVEVRIQKASGPSGNDGEAEIWLDGVSKWSSSTLDIDGLGDPTIFEFGAGLMQNTIDTALTSGTIFLDEVVLRDDDVAIGEKSSGFPIELIAAQYLGWRRRLT